MMPCSTKYLPTFKIRLAELHEFIFAGFQSLLNLLEAVGVFIEVFARATFALHSRLLYALQDVGAYIRVRQKTEVGIILNIGKQRIIKNSFKLVFLSQLTVIFSLRFFQSLNRLRKNTEVIKRATTLYLLFRFSESGPFMEQRGFFGRIFGKSTIGFVEGKYLLETGNKSVARCCPLSWSGNIGQERVVKYRF